MAEHTKTPWEAGSGDDYYIRAEEYPEQFSGHFKSDDNGPYVAYIGNRPADFGEANAAFIVKAANSHDSLVFALTELYEAFEFCVGKDAPVAIEARRVLDLVGGPAK